VDRLHKELRTRLPDIELHRRYARGDHDDPSVEEVATRTFQRILGLTKTNLCGLIIDAAAERMGVQGFRFGDDDKQDTDAWMMWQASNFDCESELLITAALETGRSFVMAEPPREGEKWPRLYTEDPSQMIIAYPSGRRHERLAAWKEWTDEWTGEIHGNLFLPDRIFKLKAKTNVYTLGGTPSTTAALDWQLRDDQTDSEINPFGEVPVWELHNRPGLQPGVVRSEIADVLGDQDACNHIALNALMAAEYGAFRQKWVTGMAVPIDPITGKPTAPVNVASNRLLAAEDENARFGTFDATQLSPYLEMYAERVKHMASVTRTPPVMILGSMINLSAEALALSVNGLVQKVKRKMRHYEQPFEDALRACFRLIGDPRGNLVEAETVWVDPEVRSASQQADASVKLVQGNVLQPQTVQELYLGLSDEQRHRDMAYMQENQTIPGMAALFDTQEPDPRLMGGMGGADNGR
jgi:hypothetical protein